VNPAVDAALILIAYLLGSISFAVIVSRLYSLPDPRSYGSGNPGATNVLRSGRKSAAAFTFAGDGAKGWLAVFIAGQFATPELKPMIMSAAAVAVVVGHVFPVFFRFEGGKGVATALGVLLALNPYLAAGTAATWIIIAVFFRISSLAAIIAALFAPFFVLILYTPAHPYVAGVAVVAALLISRHHANIRNLWQGKEGQIGQRSTDTADREGRS